MFTDRERPDLGPFVCGCDGQRVTNTLCLLPMRASFR